MVRSVMMKCLRCGRYTLRKDKCPYCGGPLTSPHPPRYSPDDKMWRYRLMLKVASGQLEINEETRRRVLESLGSGKA
ncbi:MAG: RNA-protein complex protein Nop10 [Caldivirga sp.]|jgi:H/ACA ribonucleoprotein complex subunit 3|uniref:RNA-protein complex protein Nop10 n=1 Tax=Caldivirga sp. MU80 TaxID=1650354 RepID=UPI000749AA3F|nr:RNA-protein complex protein Nop10 [Caldivirga sp. MU80]KUO82844.1 MAG: ribosome biogenesis protein [Caldivirga sp. MG_3]